MLRFLRRDRSSEESRQAEAEKTQHAVEKSRQSWFGRLRSLLSGSHLDDSVWDELEEVLISADVGVDTALALVEKLKQQANQGGLNEPDHVWQALRRELIALLEEDPEGPAPGAATPPAAVPSSTGLSSTGLPTTILMVGVNGVGKTTSIAKLAQHFKGQGSKVLLGAGDTFRAAAIDQLQLWGRTVGADVIAHQQGGDPGAVVYDAFEAARARSADVLIIDTAGRLHTKSNLMDELSKIRRVLGRLDPSAPHEVLLTLDATTGQNGLTQARQFTEAVNCTGIFLAKLDGTARGGIVLAIRRELGLPILFIGTGEHAEDIAPFDAEQFVDALLAPSV